MKQFIAIFRKEVLDNIRDRRSLFFALLYGPLLLPALIIGPIALGVKKHSINFEQSQTIHMEAPERAPNLVQYLREENIRVAPVDEDLKSGLEEGHFSMVLSLAEDYETRLRQGQTATMLLHYNGADDESTKLYRKVHSILSRYGQQLTAQRMQIRGMDTAFLKPFHLIEENVATGNDAEKMLARMLPFIVILSLTMGGFYLAVDTTAGERERHSLEPLLSLSVSRQVLVAAKFCAVMLFVGLSGFLSILSAFILFQCLPVKELSALIQPDPWRFFLVFLVSLPLVVFFTSAMMLIATYAKNTKEAQTHLGMAMMLPMAPFFIIQFANVKTSTVLMAVPVMSQYLSIEKVLTGEAQALAAVVASVAGTLFCALCCYLITVLLYRKEDILNS